MRHVNPKQVKQSVWRLLGIIFFNILGSLLGFIILAAAARNMTLSEFGLLGIFTGLLYVPGLMAGVVQIDSMKVLPTSYTIDHSATSIKHNQSRIVSHFVFSVLVSGILAIFLTLNLSTAQATLAQSSSLVTLCFVIIFGSLFQGRYLSSGKFMEFHAIGFLVSVIRTIVTIILLENGYGIAAFLLTYALSTVLVGIFTAIKSNKIYWASTTQFTRKFFTQASVLAMTAFCFQLDVIFSRRLLSYEDTGVYFAAAQLAKFVCLLALSAALALLPTIMNSATDEQGKKATIMRGIKFSFFFSLILSLALLLIGSKAINFVFGKEFAGSIHLMPYFAIGILSWSILLTNINLTISSANYQVIFILFIVMILNLILLSISSSMDMIGLSWSITGTFGLVLYAILNRKN